MATRLQLRKGTTTEHNTFVGANGEVTVDTTKKALVLHDGVTAGGKPLPTLESGKVPVAQLPDSTTSTKGVVQLATQAEVNAGANGEKAIVPNTLSGGVRSLLNVSGGAPMYACRAWVNFNGNQLNGTYSQAGTTVTVTMTAHGMSVGQNVNLTITSGTAVSGSYTVETVANANTFTYTAGTNLTTSGNVTRNTFVRASGNVSSITDNGVGDYTINFSTAMQDVNYVVNVVGNAVGNGTNVTYLTEHSAGNTSLSRTTSSVRVLSAASSGGAGGPTDHVTVNVAVFR